MASTRSDDDLLEDPPPLDDGEEDEENAPDDGADLDPGLDDNDTDDEVASDLAVGELLEPIRDEGGVDAEDGRELDVGATETVDDVMLSRDDDDIAGAPGEDLSIGVDEVPDEGAEDLEGENPGPEGDEVDESALPAMDADDEGLEGIEREAIELPEEVPLPAWSPLLWEQIPLPLVAEPMKAVALRGVRVIAAGQALVELQADQTGALHAVPCASPTLPTVLTALALPDDGPPVLASDGLDEVSNLIAFGTERSLLARLSPEGLLRISRNRGDAWADVQSQDEVAGFCVDEAGVLVAAVISGNVRGLRRSSDGVGWSFAASRAGHTLGWQRPVLVASRSGATAVATLEGAIDVSMDAGADWSRHAVPRWLTSIAFVAVSGRNTLVGTLFVESEDKSYLFSVEPDGSIALVADLSPAVGVASDGGDDDSEGLGRAESVLWDEARGWLWVAGRFGLQAWRPALTA